MWLLFPLQQICLTSTVRLKQPKRMEAYLIMTVPLQINMPNQEEECLKITYNEVYHLNLRCINQAQRRKVTHKVPTDLQQMWSSQTTGTAEIHCHVHCHVCSMLNVVIRNLLYSGKQLSW